MTSYLSFHVFTIFGNKNKPADWNRVIWQDKHKPGGKSECKWGRWRRLKTCHSKFINWLHKTTIKKQGRFFLGDNK